MVGIDRRASPGCRSRRLHVSVPGWAGPLGPPGERRMPLHLRQRFLWFAHEHKRTLSLFALVVMLIGWTIGPVEPGSWAESFVFPAYGRSLVAIEELRAKRPLTADMVGFDEVA